MTWTRFMDMYSGGGLKEPQQYIYIEAPEAEAKVIFYNRFGHDPERVTCTCCGEDYSIQSEDVTLAQATAGDRNCDYLETPRYPKRFDDPWYYLTLDEYIAQDNVLVIRAGEIGPRERRGDVPGRDELWSD